MLADQAVAWLGAEAEVDEHSRPTGNKPTQNEQEPDFLTKPLLGGRLLTILEKWLR